MRECASALGQEFHLQALVTVVEDLSHLQDALALPSECMSLTIEPEPSLIEDLRMNHFVEEFVHCLVGQHLLPSPLGNTRWDIDRVATLLQCLGRLNYLGCPLFLPFSSFPARALAGGSDD